MLTRSGRWLLMPLVWILGASAANADQIELNNGDRLTGTLEGISASKALLNTGYAGTIPVSLNEIKGLHTEQDFRVRTATGVMRGRFVVGEDGQALVGTSVFAESLSGILHCYFLFLTHDAHSFRVTRPPRLETEGERFYSAPQAAHPATCPVPPRRLSRPVGVPSRNGNSMDTL